MNTEIAELMGKDGVLYEVAEKVQYNRTLTTEEKEIAEVADAWARNIGETGRDTNGEIAEYIKRVVQEEVYNAPDELLDMMFDRGSVGEFDDVHYDKAVKNTLVAHEASKGGTVDRSWLDLNQNTTVWKNRQVETDISYADLRKNGFKSIALLTTYAKESLQNALFYDVFGKIDSLLVSGDQVVNVTGETLTQTAMDALSLYLLERNDSSSVAVSLTKYAQSLARMNGYSDFMSDAMKNDFNRYGIVKHFDGVKIATISSAKKQGNGNLLIPDQRIFGVAGKIGNLDMRGDVHVYEDMDNSNEKVILRIKDFTYGFNINEIDNLCKIAFTK